MLGVYIICSMSAPQSWDPTTYARNARFVSDLGSPVVELLAPKHGERILDLGCGDGALTKKLVDLGCEVVAVDSSAPQVEAARKLGLDAHVIDAEALPSGKSSMLCSATRSCTGSSESTG